MNTKNLKIVFVHGAWVTPQCWDNFSSFFSNHGYECIAPAWPGKDRSVKEQQAHPDKLLARTGIQEIVAHYEKIIRALPEPPILIGHSFGGLFVQLLLDRGLGRAGIVIDSAPPKGITPFRYPSLVRSNLYVLTTPFGWKKIIRWPFEKFSHAFVHTLPEDERRKIYEDSIVPETGRIFFQAAFAPFHNLTKVDFKKNDRAPLLFIAGEKDQAAPPGLNRENYRKQKMGGVKTDFKEFPGRTHALIVMDGWEEIAKYISNWLDSLKK